MSRLVYVNGRYVPYRAACVHVEDRGFQFADAVYEVCEIAGGQFIDEARHLDRLERSLRELEIPPPMSRRALAHVLRETARRNRVHDGLAYLQVTRGVHPRDFHFPPAGTKPSVVCLARSTLPGGIAARAAKGISVATMPDMRWGRCDLKTVMLLPACLAKMTAERKGAQEAWFLDENGHVTEGASSNAWIVDAAGRVLTRPADRRILSGVTRAAVCGLLIREGLAFVERPFHRDEALAAAEAFVTSASQAVMPVVRIDGHAVGSGTPGTLTRALREKYLAAAGAGARTAVLPESRIK